MKAEEMLRLAEEWRAAGRFRESASLLGDAMDQASQPVKRKIVALWEGMVHRTNAAVSNLGLALMRGDGVPANPMRGAGLLRRVLDSGDPEFARFAHNFLGHFYLGTFDTPPEAEQAIEHFEAAAALGAGEAAFNAGLLLDQGISVARDVPRAVVNYRLGARLGSVQAKTNLALLIMLGEVSDATSDDAADLLLEAAHGGDEGAELILMTIEADALASITWPDFSKRAPRREFGGTAERKPGMPRRGARR